MCLLLPASAIGQTSRGGISGTVEDKSGAVVPDATVEIEQRGTGLKLSVTTTNAGVFSFVDLPIAFYTVTISHAGFQTQKITGLEVQVGRISSLTITMNVAQQAQTVEVQAAAATIETSESALNAVVNTRAIQEMPLNGRDFRQLLQLTPGFNSQSSMNGNRPSQNNWQIDGVDNNDFWHNSEAVNQGSISGVAGVLLPIDSIEEFNQQSVGGADFGRNPGSMVNVAIKSGSNDFHGTLYYFNRNDAFAKPSPFGDYGKLRNHNFGGSIGGPILKDKAFFFFNFEAQRFIAGNSIRATVPSDAWVAQAEALMTAKGVSPNPVMLALLSTLWPAAIKSAPATTNNFFSTANNNYRSNNGVARVDYAFNSKERLFVRGFVGSGDAVAYAGCQGSVFQDYFQAVPSRQQNWAAVLNSTFGSRFVNQFLFGVNYFLQNFDDQKHNQDVIALGFNTASADPGSPHIAIDGFPNGGVGETPNLGRTDTTYHFTDDLSYTLGAHALKFGGEFRRAKLWVHYIRDARGNFDFDGAAPQSGAGGWGGTQQQNSLADFLAGYINKSNANIATGNPVRNWYVNSVSWHAQDNWQVTPRLNFNYGLRWDYNSPIYDPTHTVSTFLPSAPGGLAIPPQTLSTLYPRDLNNFAPRLGFAFTPTRGGKTVIRGAWGIYYDVTNGNLFIDNRAKPGGRGPSRNPGGPKPVFSIQNDGGPLTVVNQQPIFGSVTPQPPFGVYGVNQNLRSPYVQNFSLNVQHQLTSKVVVQAGYVGSQGRKLIVTENINQPAASVTPYPSIQAARPFFSQFPTFSGITEISSAGNSQFNSMQLSMRGTSWHGLSGQLAYTVGHVRDEMSAPRNNRPTDNNNLRSDYANADFDTRHNVSGSVIYDVPQFGQSLPRLTKGWELAALTSYDSGFPFSVLSGFDNSHTGNKQDKADELSNPFRGVVQPAGGTKAGVQWFNPGAFPQQCPAITPSCPQISFGNAPGTFGNTKRNQFNGPRFKTVDFSVIKNTPITERVKTQFRVEMFNVFNILNLAQPDNCSCDGAANGLISSTLHAGDAPGIGSGEPFNVQFALKIIF
jgi:hypothetical protein